MMQWLKQLKADEWFFVAMTVAFLSGAIGCATSNSVEDARQLSRRIQSISTQR